ASGAKLPNLIHLRIVRYVRLIIIYRARIQSRWDSLERWLCRLNFIAFEKRANPESKRDRSLALVAALAAPRFVIFDLSNLEHRATTSLLLDSSPESPNLKRAAKWRPLLFAFLFTSFATCRAIWRYSPQSAAPQLL